MITQTRNKEMFYLGAPGSFDQVYLFVFVILYNILLADLLFTVVSSLVVHINLQTIVMVESKRLPRVPSFLQHLLIADCCIALMLSSKLVKDIENMV